MLMQAFWLEGRRRFLTVHLPQDGVEPVTRMLEAGCIFMELESFSFLLEGNGLRVAHSADLGAVEDLEPLLSQPVDLLVCEMAHIEVEAATAYVRSRPVRRVLFVHLDRGLRQDLARTRRRLKAGLGGIPFSIARDGDQVTVSPGS